VRTSSFPSTDRVDSRANTLHPPGGLRTPNAGGVAQTINAANEPKQLWIVDGAKQIAVQAEIQAGILATATTLGAYHAVTREGRLLISRQLFRIPLL
jgi:hypothetical protein